MKLSKPLIIFSISILVLGSIYALGNKDKADEKKQTATEQKEKTELKKDFVKINFFLDTKNENPKTHFNWETKDKNYNDNFDAVSGASKSRSTKRFRDFASDSSGKNYLVPKSLRNLFLYAVASPELLKKDNLKIGQEGKKLTITFNHRQIDYKIETDPNGILHVPEAFEDIPDTSLKTIYSGKLKANLTPEGILTLKGRLDLTEQKPPEPKEPEEESEGSDKKEENEAKTETTENE